MSTDQKFLHNVACCSGGKRRKSVLDLSRIFGLCIVGALTLTGCEDFNCRTLFNTGKGNMFFTPRVESAEGCLLNDLYPKIMIDGKNGSTQQEVAASGVYFCETKPNLDGSCVTPVPTIYTEVVVLCPFLFNTWDMAKSVGKHEYGLGEQEKRRGRQIATCAYYSKVDIGTGARQRLPKPRWCFTDWCVDEPLDCFSSEEAAENAKPWIPKGVRSPTASKEEAAKGPAPAPAPEVAEATAAAPADASAPAGAPGPSEAGPDNGNENVGNAGSASNANENDVPEDQHGGTGSADAGKADQNADAGKADQNGDAAGENDSKVKQGSELQIHETAHSSQHQHRGARKSTLQVTQAAFVVGRP